ncbi:MAG: CdvA-like protein [Candidatus Bathyarchaeota archaeon]|nr:MAG: CdvA-like protein [Candidatus Bathyarchaeota archaeon]
MSKQTSNLFPYLGKPVKDEYGHTIGTLASFLVTPGGRINGVFIEHGEGDIKQYSSDQIKTKDGEAMLFSTLKMQADNFCNQIPLLWRKTQAIKDLNEKKKIPEDMYGDLYSTFEGALSQLKNEAENTIADVEKEIEECNARVKELNSALINLEIEREIGQVDEESYLTAMRIVKEGLKRVNSEKNDFEALKNNLSNMLLGETEHEATEEKTEETEETSLPTPPSEPIETPSSEPLETPPSEPLGTSLPEPPESSSEPSGESPVVVYVKNADQPNS